MRRGDVAFQTEAVLGNSERTRAEAEALLAKNERDFEQQYTENEAALQKLALQVQAFLAPD